MRGKNAALSVGLHQRLLLQLSPDPRLKAKDTLLRPRNFRLAVAYRLGMYVINEEISCPSCQQTIDKYGDPHATCCTKNGDLIIRHNSLRNLVED